MSKDRYPSIFPNFQKWACCEKYLKDNKLNNLNFILKICSDICPWTLSVPQSSELRSRKTVRFSEQIMSADKYPSIFSRQMEAIVLIILQIVFVTSAVLIIPSKICSVGTCI